jgi:Ubiquitin carboxyl-terminal hydrolase
MLKVFIGIAVLLASKDEASEAMQKRINFFERVAANKKDVPIFRKRGSQENKLAIEPVATANEPVAPVAGLNLPVASPFPPISPRSPAPTFRKLPDIQQPAVPLGLTNFGNSCYSASVVQVLLRAPGLDFCQRSQKPSQDAALAEHLCELQQALLSGQEQTTRGLFKNLRAMVGCGFNNTEPQDATAFLEKLSDQIGPFFFAPTEIRDPKSRVNLADYYQLKSIIHLGMMSFNRLIESHADNFENWPKMLAIQTFDTPADFPDRFQKPDEANREYRLFAIIVASNEHYYTYAHLNGSWFKLDDYLVTKLNGFPGFVNTRLVFYTCSESSVDAWNPVTAASPIVFGANGDAGRLMYDLGNEILQIDNFPRDLMPSIKQKVGGISSWAVAGHANEDIKNQIAIEPASTQLKFIQMLQSLVLFPVNFCHLANMGNLENSTFYARAIVCLFQVIGYSVDPALEKSLRPMQTRLVKRLELLQASGTGMTPDLMLVLSLGSIKLGPKLVSNQDATSFLSVPSVGDDLGASLYNEIFKLQAFSWPETVLVRYESSQQRNMTEIPYEFYFTDEHDYELYLMFGYMQNEEKLQLVYRSNADPKKWFYLRQSDGVQETRQVPVKFAPLWLAYRLKNH